MSKEQKIPQAIQSFEDTFSDQKANEIKYKIEEEGLPIRFKVTDRCQWQCSFCHNEGNMFTSDVKWTPELEQVIKSLRKVLGSQEIHFTGGEPTASKYLEQITAGLASLGLEVKTTTNGQFSKKTLKELIAAGLSSFNFSVHSLDPDRFLRFQTGRGGKWQDRAKRVKDDQLNLQDSKVLSKNKHGRFEWARKNIYRQLENIVEAKKQGADVKINSVICNENDIVNALEILNWARENDIPFRLLNNLGNGMISVNAIRKFIRDTRAEEILRKVHTGSSSCSTVYRLPDGYEFAFKQIRDFKLESMCQKCPRLENGSCEEQFYGVRLQEVNEEMYVILCIQELNYSTMMTVDEFLQSPQLIEIQSYLQE